MRKTACLFFSCSFLFLMGQSQVIIGNQTWTSQNLNVHSYRNGDAIPEVTDAVVWKNLTTGAWCWYNNDSIHYWQYGKLYNWYAVTDPRGLAPAGWHVPGNAEWNQLVNYLDINADTTCSICSQSVLAGGTMKETGTIHWMSPNTGATNSSGFTALPGGYRGINGEFGFTRTLGYWWSSEQSDAATAWGKLLLNDAAVVFTSYYDKVDGFSVRLVKDNSTVPVMLQHFSGYTKDGCNVLHWSTTKEPGTRSYEIEKSIDGTSFNIIGNVSAASSSAGIQNYTYTDKQPGAGINYYRLRMVDVDGGYTYSGIVAVSNKELGLHYTISPNPADQRILVNSKSILLQDAWVRLTAMDGRVVAQKKFLQGTALCFIETAFLQQGVYILTIDNAGTSVNTRVIISR